MIDAVARTGDEFYIGYEERMPPGIARRVVGGVAMFAGGAGVGVLVALMAQQRLPASRFEFGVVRTLSGVLRHDPYPSLDVDGRRIWLVGPGKFGADEIVARTPAGPVAVDGTAIQRGHLHMLEVSHPGTGSESVQSQPRVGSESTPHPGVRAQPPANGARVTLTGEIVDSKCFLGAMNPGEGTVHRDCARRCLSGGMPPMLLVRDRIGREELVVLVSADGRPIGRQMAGLAGKPVVVRGTLIREGDQYVLFTDR